MGILVKLTVIIQESHIKIFTYIHLYRFIVSIEFGFQFHYLVS